MYWILFFLTKINYFINFFLVFFFFKLILYNSNCLDIFFKILENMNFVNTYSFFWVNYWYIYNFILILLFTYGYYFMNYFFRIQLVLIVIIQYVYFLETLNFFINNFQINLININATDVNTFLINTINNVHPALFYFCVVLYFISAGAMYLYNVNERVFIFEFLFRLMLILLKQSFFINAITLFLGSWWALQEGSWGGWWNWDASETLGLLPFISSFILLHYWTGNNIKMFYLFILLFFHFNLLYWLTQLNFDNISHNFGIKFFFFFDHNLFLLELIFSAIISIFYILFYVSRLLTNLFFLFNSYCFSRWTLSKYAFIFGFSWCFIKIYLLSFNVLLNYFYINFWNFDISLNYNLIFFFVLFLLNCISFNIYYWSLIWMSAVPMFFFFFSIIFLNSSPTVLFHGSLLNFFFINIMFMNFYVFDWAIYSIFYPFFNFTIFYFLNWKLIIDACMFDYSWIVFVFNEWNAAWSTNSLLLCFNYFCFFFAAMWNNFYSIFYLNLHNTFITLYINDLSINNLLISAAGGFLTLFIIFYRNFFFFR